ncbi:MAG TPA: cytidylate kinase, partial [Gammaproteobacteria bacterium]|nr:cytidylate kinase [Gammaproteobacteria bacterium]
MANIPIITIDGPSGSGKGTVAYLLAQQLDWHYLDSGALYRVLAYAAQQYDIEISDTEKLVQLARQLPVTFDVSGAYL